MKDNNQPLWRRLLRALYERYPSDRKGDVNFKRLIKMLYLLDWKHCIDTGRQATDVAWIYDFYGPYSSVFEEISGDKFEAFKAERGTGEISKELSIYINSIIYFSAPLTYEKFINCIYSTHPILTTAQGEPLDLVSRAKDYIILREKRRKIQQENERKESEKSSEARAD